MKKIALKIIFSGLLSMIFSPVLFAQEKASWESLFNGKDFTNWKLVGSNGVADIIDSAFVCHMTTNTPEHTFVCTQKSYKDFILEMDVKTDSGYNTGILLRCIDKPKNCDTCNVSLYGYQLKIDPSPTRRWTGGIFDDFGKSWHWLYDLSKDDRARNAYRIGYWNHIRVEAIGPSIKTWVNGVPATNMINSKYSKGTIALKIHSLNNRPEQEAMLGRFKNIRIITKNTKNYVKPMNIPAIQVE